ncbi:ABC transporter substrate-binding protein [Rhodovarius crocodyli]|uniref:ABC transporter substrate-binding protein n=1 Tax=Rhodovarius crocodyli TaxID=1979269 RepID=A0A437MNE2_9PROT|nr:ABC transporter substrate-binding protein [Rhodovarius crocodyli]
MLAPQMSRPSRRHVIALLSVPAVVRSVPVHAQGETRAFDFFRAQAETPRQAELRLAAVLPLSGPFALLGDETWRGLELAAQAAEAPLRFLRLDSPDPAQAVAEIRRMQGAEKPVAIFGSVSSALALAASQAADAAGIMFFELNATANAITDRGLRHVWRLGVPARDIGLAGLEALQGPLARQSRGLKIAMLSDGGGSAESIADALQASLESAGMGLDFRFAAPAAEMGGAVQRLRASGAEVLFHTGQEGDIAALFRVFREASWRPRIVVGLGGAHAVEDAARAAGEGHDGCWVVDVPPTPAAHPFVDSYRRRYGAAPRSGHSFAAFSLAQPILTALRAADPRSAVAALDERPGALPNGWGIGFDSRQQNTRAKPVLARWEDGRLSPP